MVGLRIQIKHINTSQILDPTNPSKLSPEGVLCAFLMSFKHDFQISLSKSANGRNQSLEIFGLKIIREKNYILRKYVNKLFIF